MKKTILIIGLLLFTTIALVVSCNYNNDKKEETAQQQMQATEQVQEDAVSDFQHFKDDAYSKISDNIRNIVTLRARMMMGKDDANEKYRLDTDSLEKRNNALKIRIDNYNDDGTGNWKIFKTSFNRAMDSLGNDLKNMSE
jgi:uncharacterized protein YdeI (BOF family)